MFVGAGLVGWCCWPRWGLLRPYSQRRVAPPAAHHPLGTGTPLNPSSRLEVNVMNEPVRGGEPELAIDPLNPQHLVVGHTVVANNYTGGNPLGTVDGGLQISADGGQTWTPDQSLGDRITPGGLSFTDPPNPFLISRGLPANGFSVDPKSGRGGPDRSERTGWLHLRRRGGRDARAMEVSPERLDHIPGQ